MSKEAKLGVAIGYLAEIPFLAAAIIIGLKVGLLPAAAVMFVGAAIGFGVTSTMNAGLTR